MRSVRRVAQKVNKGNSLGRQAFVAVGYKILGVSKSAHVKTLFDVLSGDKPLSGALAILPNCTPLKDLIGHHNPEDWKECTHWVEWWTSERHLSEY